MPTFLNLILDASIDDCHWYEEKIKINSKVSSVDVCDTKKIPIIPKSGWKKFPLQSVPRQLSYGHSHYYALESLPNVSFEDSSSKAKDSDEGDDNGLGHMTGKPFKQGRKYLDSGYVQQE